MEKLEINHFKAFGSRLAFIPKAEKKNLLVYGENGSGKTSVYEAIRMVFYYKRMLKSATKRGASKEELRADEEAFYRSYNHKQPAGEPIAYFNIAINSTDFKTFNTKDYQCFMLTNADINYIQQDVIDGKVQPLDVLNIKSLLEKVYFPEFELDTFLKDKGTIIISRVNQSLRDDFIEEFQIGFANDKYDVFIEDTYRNLKESNGLHKMFNEAKINLTVILLLLETVKLLQDSTKHCILILDDLITSLDAGNRLFFTNYFLTKFEGFQKILLTHNVGFNNLIVERIKEYKQIDSWLKYNIYITEEGPQLYSYDELRSAKDIRKDFDAGYLNPTTVGVELRKRFEAVINEIAKMFQIDATSRAMDIISDIIQREDNFYYRRSGKKTYDSNNLVTDIDALLKSSLSDADKIAKISAEIAKYQNNADIIKLVQFIKEFHYYERLLLHAMAHGTTPMPVFNQKEVYAATKILEKLENLFDKINSGTTTP